MSSKMPRNVLLNPGPVTTTDAVKRALLVPDICHREKEFTDLLQCIRRDLLKVIRADDRYTSVLFGASGTGAIEACLSSVIPPHKKVAIINNGSYGQRLMDIAKRYGIDAVEIKSPYDRPLSLDALESALLSSTDIQYVAVVHHETSLGTLNPLREIGALCHRLGRSLIVDAMSSFGGVVIDAEEDRIDFIISSSNKCLHGMPGLSFVICKTERLLETEGCARSYYFDLHQQYHALEKTGQMPFTPPVQVAYSFKQALDEYFAETPARSERYQSNYACLMSGLKALGFGCVTPTACQSHLLATVTFPEDGKGYDFDAMHDYLYKRGFTIYPKKLPINHSFRVACMGDLNKGDIDAFLSALRAYVNL